GEDHALVVLELSDLDEPPARCVELSAVRILEIRHADQLAVGGVTPAVVRAQELDRVALVVAADFHPAVPAGVQEDVDAAAAVATEDHRFLAHRRHREVAGSRDLTLVADEEPGSREDLLLLLAIDRLVHEDLAADDPALRVHQALHAR